MPHDKLRDATRRRMAETGEPYTVARRAVLRDRQPAAEGPARRFSIRYGEAWEGRLTAVLDRVLFRGGPGVSHVDVDTSVVRVRMATFRLDIPRASVGRYAGPTSGSRGAPAVCTAAAPGFWSTARLTAWWSSSSTHRAGCPSGSIRY